MKKTLFILFIIAGIFSAKSVVVEGATILFPYQGGTGIGTATVGEIGDCLKVLSASPFAYELGACGTGGGGGGNYWTYLTGFLSPATTTDAVRASYFVATSTATNTMPVFYSSTSTIGKELKLERFAKINLFNTDDQTTNYQKAIIGFDGSIFSFNTEKGGSSQEVTMIVGTSSRPHIKLQPATQPFFRFDNPNATNDTTNPQVAFVATGGMNAASGFQSYLGLSPIFDQTGTGGYCVLCIAPFEQTLGSGEQYLIRAGTSTAQDLFTVNNIGNLYTPYFSVFNNASENKATLMTVRAPMSNPQESTVTTLLDYGSNQKQWIDWTIEDYGTDNQGSINIVRSGTKPLLPFVIRFWDSNLGPVSQYGTTNFVTVPAGNSGFGVSSSTLRTDVMVHISSSTIPYGLAFNGESGADVFSVSSAGVTASKSFTATSTSGMSSFYNLVAGSSQRAFSVLNNFVGAGTNTPQTTLDVRGPSISTTATTLGNINVMATNTQASDIGGAITFGGFNDASASVQRVFSSIEGRKENGTAGSSVGYLKFRVNNAGTLVDAMRISSTGNVGIGTTTPSRLFTVQGNGYFLNNITAASSTFTNATSSTSFFSGLGTFTNMVVNTLATFLNAIFTGSVDMSSAKVKQHVYPSFTFPGTATTTTATTTVPLGTAFTAELWNTAECWVSSGTGAIAFSTTSTATNVMTPRTASTTPLRWTLASFNTVATSSTLYMHIGPLTNAQVSCSIDKIVNN